MKLKDNQKVLTKMMKIKKGLKQFIIRTVIFFAILISIQFGIFLFVSQTEFFRKYLAIPDEFYIPVLTGLSKQNVLSSLLFVVIAFILWRFKDIKKFSAYRQNKKETAVWSIMALTAFTLHYALKYFINRNIETALPYSLILTVFKYTLNILFVIFLAFAVYNKKFLFSFTRKYRKDVGIFSIIFLLYYWIIWWFQDSWLVFSSIIGKVLYFLFSRISDNVVFRVSDDVGPILGVDNFYVGISKVCSGIESLLFFISLFVIIVITNWDNLNKKRMLLLFIPGVIGTYLLNILRIFLLILIAVKFSPKFAIDVFHTNAGWIFFLAYFIVFWHFGRKWVILNE